MKTNEMIHGFKVLGSESIPECDGTLWHLYHEGSGAPLLYLDRDDRNMTFSIAFRTPPKDDTGVFHIIEHSVLCGSKKFPVKEPFVELLKGSLNTFLNAMTYEDRTVYPVSSRCERDFLNLTDVYLDAVFHPRMLEDERIFLQEGWHYEYDKESDSLSYNGVVYNEMCGAYSSPDELGATELRRSLFPDTLYRYDSGGAPDAIPSLTYENFKKAHQTYYHPSNSMIFLDGRINEEKTLALIDSYLSEYEKTDIKVVFPQHAPTHKSDVTVEFEPSGEPLCRLLFGYVYSSPDRRVEDYSLTLLDLALTGSNDAQLKRAMLDTGLCEDVIMSVSRTVQTQITIEVIGVKLEDVSKIEGKLESIIRNIAKKGIDKKRLSAVLNNNEFKLREADFGSLPRGVAYALSAYALWNYGIDPARGLRYEEEVAEARRYIDGVYFEELLLRSTVDNPHRATVIMVPKDGLADEESRIRKAALSKIRSEITEDTLADIIKTKDSLDEWQATPDSEENLNTLPILSLSDVEPKTDKRKTAVKEIDGAKYLNHGIETDKITYMTLCFEADDLSDGELMELSLLTVVLKNLRTASYTTSELQSEIRSQLGTLSFSATPYPRCDGTGRSTLAFTVSASALERNKGKMVDLIREILTATDFSDTGAIEKQLIQARSAMEELLTADTLSFAMSRVTSSLTEAGMINEKMSGYDAYVSVKALVAEMADDPTALPERLAALLSRLAVRSRLTVSLASEDEELAVAIINALPGGTSGEAVRHTPGGRVREALRIPGRVSYAVKGGICPGACEILGTMRVARSILSYEYLWSEIRVKGGAYGAGFIVRKSGELGFYSYRDPSPARSLDCYGGASDFLRRLSRSGADLTKYIIGAFGEYDILTTPRTEASQALYDYMTGWTAEHEARLIKGILTTDKDALLRAADVIDSTFASPTVCVAGDPDAISAVKPELTVINPR